MCYIYIVKDCDVIELSVHSTINIFHKDSNHPILKIALIKQLKSIGTKLWASFKYKKKGRKQNHE